MKFFSWVILFFASMVSWAADDQAGREWLNLPPEKIESKAWGELPSTDFYEVVASKESVAVTSDLVKKSFIPLNDETAKYYTGHYYQSQNKKTPFLVRAVYGDGGNGGFTVARLGDDLLIRHDSLGHGSIYHKSALIINLDFKPRKIFVMCGMDE